MGEMYRDREATLKRDLAIKVPPAFWSRHPERLHRFEQEAQESAANCRFAGSRAGWIPVFTRDIGSQEIYALTVKWP
jgi:hypothetical protein